MSDSAGKKTISDRVFFTHQGYFEVVFVTERGCASCAHLESGSSHIGHVFVPQFAGSLYGATRAGRSIFHVDMISFLSTGTVV